MNVDELRQHIAGSVCFEKFCCLLPIHLVTPVTLPPQSITTLPSDSPR
jgi:hypothetical protein